MLTAKEIKKAFQQNKVNEFQVRGYLDAKIITLKEFVDIMSSR